MIAGAPTGGRPCYHVPLLFGFLYKIDFNPYARSMADMLALTDLVWLIISLRHEWSQLQNNGG